MLTIAPQFSGPVFAGLAFNWMLQGTLSLQVYIYYLCFPNDTTTVKCLVYFVCIHEWAQTGVASLDVYRRFEHSDYNAQSAGILSIVSQGQLSWIAMFIMPALTAATVQSFYAWRIGIISQRRLFSVAIVIVSISACGSGIVSALNLKKLDTADAVTWDVAANIWLWSSVLADAMIAGFMTFSLRRFTSLRNDTNLLVNRLIKLVIETGCLTAIGAIATLVTWLGFPNTLVSACPLLILSKLYANTLLITLNNRAFMNAQVSGVNIARSPLVLQMTSRQTVHVLSLDPVPGMADIERPVEVALPPSTDDNYISETTK